MQTKHSIFFRNAQNLNIENESVDLIVTSPPYPMIEMWDDIFCQMNSDIDLNEPMSAYNMMHQE